MNVNFILYKEGMKVSIPLITINEDQSPAIRRGAFFLQVTRFLKCKVSSPDIPAALQVNLAGAANKEVVRLNRVEIPDSLELCPLHDNFCVGTVVGKRDATAATEA